MLVEKKKNKHRTRKSTSPLYEVTRHVSGGRALHHGCHVVPGHPRRGLSVDVIVVRNVGPRDVLHDEVHVILAPPHGSLPRWSFGALYVVLVGRKVFQTPDERVVSNSEIETYWAKVFSLNRKHIYKA